MHNGKDDVQTDRSRPNSLLDGENIIEVHNSTFLPSIELVQHRDDPRVNSIFGKDGIVIEELLTYIEPVIVIRNRSLDSD